MLLAVAAILTSCTKEPLPTVDGMIGSWKLVSIDGDQLATKSFADAEGLEVILIFSKIDFVIQQRVGNNVSPATYTGTWSLAKNVLSGKYADGTPWASTYKVALTDRMMTLSSSTETQVYTKID